MPKSTFIPSYSLLNKTTLVIVTSLFLGIGQPGHAASKATKLKVNGGQTVSYFCDNDNKLAARYYNLSDNSLNFVKLTLNGKIYTLPQVVSASGVRYTDEHTVEWWSKGDKALLDENVTDDKSKLVECAEATAKKAAVAEKVQPEVKHQPKTAVAAEAKPEVIEKAKAEAAAKAKEQAKAEAKAEAVDKAKAAAKQEAADRARQEAKEAAAKQVKETVAVEQPKKAASGTEKK